MKVILDEMIPTELGQHLPSHAVHHVIDRGWRHISHGKLLTLCEESGFEIFITKDGNLPYQQNLVGRNIAIIVVRPVNQSLGAIVELASLIDTEIQSIAPGMVKSVSRRSISGPESTA